MTRSAADTDDEEECIDPFVEMMAEQKRKALANAKSRIDSARNAARELEILIESECKENERTIAETRSNVALLEEKVSMQRRSEIMAESNEKKRLAY